MSDPLTPPAGIPLLKAAPPPASARVTADPTQETVASVSPPWWTHRTTYAAAGAALVAATSIIVAWVSPLSLPEKIQATSGALGILLTALAAIFARAGGVEAGARAQENLRGPL